MTETSPFWYPYQGLGLSSGSNPLYGVFYPLNWLYAVVPESMVAQMLTWQSFAHVIWGAWGCMYLVRRLGAGRLGMTVSGLAWGLGGYTTSMWTAGLLLLAGAWIPWTVTGMLALWRATEKKDGPGFGRAFFKAAAPIGMGLLMGEVFVALMGVAVGLLVVALAALGKLPNRHPRPLMGGLWVGFAVVMGMAMGAATLVPAKMNVGQTNRAQTMPRAEAEICSIPPMRFLEMVSPYPFGAPGGPILARSLWVSRPWAIYPWHPVCILGPRFLAWR